MLSGAAADAVWFNSAWHRDALLAAATELAEELPGPELRNLPAVLAGRAAVLPPGHDLPRPTRRAHGRPLHLLWAARWEADKDPTAFCTAIDLLAASGADFRLSVVGGDAARAPAPLRRLRADHGDRLQAWGRQERSAYRELLATADVVVSTARHEFFGIAAVEAAAAGACPLLPRRLAYPEVFAALPQACFHSGDPAALADRLAAWCVNGPPLPPDACAAAVAHLHWHERAAALDAAATALVDSAPAVKVADNG